MDERFSATYVEHLRHPRGLAPEAGPAFTPSGTGVMEGPRLDATITVWVALSPEGRLLRAAFRSRGLPESVPAASALCALLDEGDLDPADAAALTVDDLARVLGPLPTRRRDAALRALQALRRALADAGVIAVDAAADADAETACHCVGLTFRDLRLAAAGEIDRLNLQRRTGFGGGCGTCLYAISDFLDGLERPDPSPR